jgi:biopolymer transport protein ExbB
LLDAFLAADAPGRAIGLLLLAMSVASWVVILWKSWLLRRAARTLPLATAGFWQALDLDDAERRLAAADASALALPLLQAARHQLALPPRALAAQGAPAARLTRALRDALLHTHARLQHGQTLLASVGATAPFVGLLGTVWGVHHALLAVGFGEGFRIEAVAGPVGEALVMTAAGLVVAIPAVLGHNVLGRRIAQAEAVLEGFAHDLRELLVADGPQAPPLRGSLPPEGADPAGGGPAPHRP